MIALGSSNIAAAVRGQSDEAREEDFPPQLIQDQFLKRAECRPNSIAVWHDGTSLTYREVEFSSRQLAVKLRERGVRVGDRVAILAERGPGVVLAMLAALRAGATFVVLDASYPAPRLEALMGLASPRALVSAGAEALLATAHRLAEGRECTVVDCRIAPSETTGAADLDEADPRQPAYMLFTSGSTGTPKCIACNHVPLVSFVRWHVETSGLREDDRFTMLSGLSHDPVMRDVFTPLSIGATLLIPRQSTITEPGALARWFAEQRATISHLTPQMGQLLSAGGESAPRLPAMRHFFWGGDHLFAALVRTVSRVAPNAAHTNFYGCTETPQAVSAYRCNDQIGIASKVPIGKGAAGARLTIVDDGKRPVDDGHEGEIAVESRHLSLGYVVDGKITPPADRGVTPDGTEIYYTGDRGVRLPSGDVELIGRADDQLKIRGYRVDLSEVTAALLSLPDISEAIALPNRSEGASRIEAFIALEPGSKAGAAGIAEGLAQALPAYMIPGRIVPVEGRLPRLPNGKIDRHSLLALAGSAASLDQPGAISSPENAHEADLIQRWSDILQRGKIWRDSSFVELGGDSLSYVEAYMAAEEVVGELPANWPELTIAQLCAGKVDVDPYWTSVDSGMLVRAGAIVSIVAFHFKAANFGYGLTGALFLVSGFMFGSIQLRDVFERGHRSPILNSFTNILVPTFVFTFAMLAVDVLIRDRSPPLASFLMSVDLINHGSTEGLERHVGIFWYVDSLLKILLILYACTWLVPAPRFNPDSRRTFILGLFAFACLVKFVLPELISPGQLLTGIDDLSPFSLSPLGNLGTFMLGAVIAEYRRTGDTVTCVLIVAIYSALDAALYNPFNGIGIGAAGLLFIFMDRISVPRSLAKLIYLVSGASLFIYMTHLYFGSITTSLFETRLPLVQTIFALIGGVLVHSLWQMIGRSEIRRFFASRIR